MVVNLNISNTYNLGKCCGNQHLVRNGVDKNGNQRYKCKDCKKTFILSEDKRIKHPVTLRKLALTFYLCGVSLRGIQKAIGVVFNKKVHFNSIDNWIKNSNSILEREKERRKESNPPPTGERTVIPIVEMDELYAFIKKNQKIRREKNTMTDEYGLLWLDNQMKLLHLK
jgi:transposase-like protein